MFPIRRLIRHGSRPFLLKRILFCLAPLLFALACYESDDIETAAVSPDGRFMAIVTAQHEMGVLDLEAGRSEPIRIYSRQAGSGVSWSPDSRTVVFVDQPANAPSSLVAADVARERSTRLLTGSDWKAWPAWLDDRRIAFLSDREAEDANVWALDLKSSATTRLIDRPADVSRLWGSPSGSALVLQTAENGRMELFAWHASDGRLAPLTHDQADPILNIDLAFAPDGHRLAASIRTAKHAELAWIDTATGLPLERLALAAPAGDLAVTGDGRVASSQGQDLIIWRPQAHWFQRTLIRQAWNGMPVAVLGGRGEKGLALKLNRNLVLTAQSPGNLTGGHIHPRRLEDLLALGYALTQQGRLKPARELLEGLQARDDQSSRSEYLVAMGRAQLERIEGQWRLADQWLARAIRAATPGSVEEEAAWLERLALAAFDAKDRPRANWILDQMPAGLDKSALAAWSSQLMAGGEARTMSAWMEIGGELRAGNDLAVAHAVNRLVTEGTATTLTLRGISLILGNDLEPLSDVGDLGARRLQKLMDQPEFQVALLVLLRRHVTGGPTPSEINSLLLGQWVRQGDFSSARELVRNSLAESEESIPEYQEMLRRFLVIEETDRWTQRAVTDVLLQKDIADSLGERLTQPEDRLMLRLAQVKKALIEGEPAPAQAWLTDVQALEAQVPPAEGDDAFGRTQTTFLMRLFKAKVAERNRRWPEAIKNYQACQELMNTVPGSWEVSPFDVGFMSELLQLGSAKDADLLRSYLEILRGAGDPLVNPSHTPQVIDVGLANLATLRKVAPEVWFQPYFNYTQGLYRSLTKQSWQALHSFDQARRQNPPPALLRRMLFEEAAMRDTLGQHALAARIYRQIYTMPETPAAQRALAIQAALQSEVACGAVGSPTARLKEILKDDTLSRQWKEWLWMQQGSGE